MKPGSLKSAKEPARRRGRPLRRSVRLAAWLAATAALAFLLFRLVAPLLISGGGLGLAIREDVARWSPYRLEFAGAPEISVWPSPTVTLREVSLRKADDGRSVMEAETLSAAFNLATALAGAPGFHDFTLRRPLFLLFRPDGNPLTLPENRPVADAVRAAAEDGAARGPWIGSLVIEDGTAVFSGDGGPPLTFTGIAASLEWPRPDAPLEGSVRAVAAGQPVSMEFSSPQFLALIGGSEAEARLRLALPGVSGWAEGTADLAAPGFFSGRFRFDVADMAAFTAWTGLELPGLDTVKAARATAVLTAADDTLRFDHLAFAVNDSTASGVMDIALPPGRRPKLTGTLAFERLNLEDPARNLPLGPALTGIDADGRTGLRFDLDFRLSAGQVLVGPFELGDLAASVLVNDKHATLDIGDSDFEGGRLTGRLTSGAAGFGNGTRLQLSVREAGLDAIAARLGVSGLLPAGRGSFDLSLESGKPLSQSERGDFSGKAALFAGEGALRPFDAVAIRSHLGEAGPLSLAAGNGRFAYNRMEARLTVDKGAVTIERAEATGASERLSLAGTIAADNRLALTGALAAADPADAAGLPALSFTLGGDLTDPEADAVSLLPAETDTGPQPP